MRIALIGAAALVPLLAGGCDQPDLTAPGEARSMMSQASLDAHYETVPTSLHATAEGMRYWYDRGFGALPALADVAYDGLTCAGCHVPPDAPASCAGCHGGLSPGTGTVQEAACLACHARQAAEIQMGLPDVHRAASLQCWDCHTSAEMHGDGTSYSSMFQSGGVEASCTGCHPPPSTRAHTVHGNRLACSTCHMATAVTCVNCHFEEEVKYQRRVAVGRATGWQFLGNFRNQVYPLNFQSLEYMGTTFVSFGPFHGHSITPQGRACEDCHASEHVLQLAAPDGALKILDWDGSMLVPAQGVIPVTHNYQSALRFDFASLSGGDRSFLATGPDAWTMLFAQPLTTLQMDALVRRRRTHIPPEGHPTCDGLLATIWVGMDPAGVPRGASVSPLGNGGYRIVGTRGDDVIVGSIGPDSLWGLAGDDVLCGLEGADVIFGGRGNDRIFGGPGADELHGEDGDDLLVAGPGADRLYGGTGDDLLLGCQGSNKMYGGPGDDQLHGGHGHNMYDGGRPGETVIVESSELCASYEEDCGGGCGGDHDDGGCGGDHDDGGCGGDHDDGGCDGDHDDGDSGGDGGLGE
jgi:hypothetical protein